MPTKKPGLLDKWKLVGLIMRDPDLTDASRRVGWALLDFHNVKTGRCYPSYETLAKRSGLKLRATKSAVEQLVSLGYLHRSKGGGRGRANEYRPAFERVHDGAPFREKKGCTATSERVHGDVRKGARERQKTVHDRAPQHMNQTQEGTPPSSRGPDGDDDDAAKVGFIAQLFRTKRRALWPHANDLNGENLLSASRQLLGVAEAELEICEWCIDSCMEKLANNGNPAPTSPMFCRLTVESQIISLREAQRRPQ